MNKLFWIEDEQDVDITSYLNLGDIESESILGLVESNEREEELLCCY